MNLSKTQKENRNDESAFANSYYLRSKAVLVTFQLEVQAEIYRNQRLETVSRYAIDSSRLTPRVMRDDSI